MYITTLIPSKQIPGICLLHLGHPDVAGQVWDYWSKWFISRSASQAGTNDERKRWQNRFWLIYLLLLFKPEKVSLRRAQRAQDWWPPTIWLNTAPTLYPFFDFQTVCVCLCACVKVGVYVSQNNKIYTENDHSAANFELGHLIFVQDPQHRYSRVELISSQDDAGGNFCLLPSPFPTKSRGHAVSRTPPYGLTRAEAALGSESDLIWTPKIPSCLLLWLGWFLLTGCPWLQYLKINTHFGICVVHHGTLYVHVFAT